jgi:general secretion pathway protein A
MYERFYNLRERPFALSPDPEYLYPSGVHREALDYLRYGIETQAGFIVITGEIGSGKTTLLQTVLQRLDSGTKVARLVNTTLEPRELLEAILLDFGVDLTSSSKPMMLRQLGEFLVRQRADGRRALLVIDEAQNLSVPALEEIRLLSNQETEKSKLLPIALVGQPNLRDKLRSPELEQLRQRVTVSYHLMPLDRPETHAYINHRLRRAALGEPLEFPAEAAAVVHARSGGVPRTINVICDATLVFGYGDERRDIDGALVEVVVAELEATGVLSPAGAVPAAPEAPAAVIPTVVPAVPPPVSRPTTSLAPAAASPAPVPVAARVGAPEARTFVPPVASAYEDAVRLREAEIAAREAELVRRERVLAEQRRIMSEEYRLLRGTPASPSDGVRPVPVVPQRVYTARRAPQRLPFWQRVFRFLAGEPAAW